MKRLRNRLVLTPINGTFFSTPLRGISALTKLFSTGKVQKLISNVLIINILFFVFSSSWALASFTIEDEKKLGLEFYDNLEKDHLIYHDRRVDDYLSKIGHKLLAGMPTQFFEYRFSVIKSSAVNAFATPGGYVYVNIGLINLVENEGELAGVLAHEMAHVSARHIAAIVDKSAKINIASLAAILAGAFLGGGGDMMAAVTTFSMAAATTMNLKYSREHEEDADRLGLSYLTRAGYDGRGMPDFLKIMRQYEFYSSSVPSYFLTHPGTDDRIRYLDGLLQTSYKGGGAKSLFGQLKRLQTILRLENDNAVANLKFFQAGLANNADDLDFLYGVAVSQGKLGMTAQALENFQKALKVAPQDVEILSALGIAYYNNGRPDDALTYLNKAIAVDGENQAALFFLGKAYEAKGDYSSAIKVYKQLEAKQTADDEVLYRLAFSYGKTNNQGESHYYFGLYFKKINKMESAVFHFKEALKSFPADSPRARDIAEQLKTEKNPRGREKEMKPPSHPG